MKKFVDIVRVILFAHSFGLIFLVSYFILQQMVLLEKGLPWEVSLGTAFISWFACTTWFTVIMCDKGVWLEYRPTALTILWLTSPFPLGLFYMATAFAALSGMSV